MKKRIILITFVSLLLCGCSKTIPTLSDGSEAVVTFEDGSMISVDELYNELKSTYATTTLIKMIDTKILEEKYADDLEDAEEYAESYVETIKMYYVDDDGNYDEDSLVSALNTYYGYTSVDEYQEALRLNYLRNLAIEDYAKDQITESEIKKYYKNNIVGDREVYHIQIIPEVTDDMTDDEIEEAESAALATAKEIIAKLKKGESFEDLAEEYSDDEDTKDEGGYLGYINKGDYGSDEFDDAAFSLTVGKYTTTPVETSEGYEIIYVTDEEEKAELDDVRDEIIETLAEEDLSEDYTLQVTALRELRKEYGVDIIDDEIESQYNTYMNNLYNSALSSNTSS